MDPHKERWSKFVLSDCIHNPVGGSLGAKIQRTIFFAREKIIIHIKTLIEAEPVIQRKAAHKRVCMISMPLQHFCERRFSGRNGPGVVVNPMMIRIASGQQGSVWRKRKRNLANRVFKKQRVRCQPVEIRRAHGFVSVTTKMIRAKCIDGDQQYIGFGRRGKTGKQKQEDDAKTVHGQILQCWQNDG